METKGKSKIADLLKFLGKDPTIRDALDRLDTTGKTSEDAAKFSVVIAQVLRLCLGVIGRKKGRVVADWLEVFTLLVQVSLLLKKNVFDRPEVRAFVLKQAGAFKVQIDAVYQLGSTYIASTLAKTRKRKPD
ncbi:MAG: hypothetical protein V4692_00225 [Bdellovibrionota bacterium]